MEVKKHGITIVFILVVVAFIGVIFFITREESEPKRKFQKMELTKAKKNETQSENKVVEREKTKKNIKLSKEKRQKLMDRVKKGEAFYHAKLKKQKEAEEKEEENSKKVKKVSVYDMRKMFKSDVVPLIDKCYRNVLKDNSELPSFFRMEYKIDGDPDVGGVIKGVSFHVKKKPFEMPEEVKSCALDALYKLDLSGVGEYRKMRMSHFFDFKKKKNTRMKNPISDDIERTVNPLVRKCHEDVLKKKLKMNIFVVITFVIRGGDDGIGRVEVARIHENKMPIPETFENCVFDSLKTVEIANIRKDRRVRMQKFYNFKSKKW